MGAKTWMLVYSDGNAREILESNPQLDRKACAELSRELFPSLRLEPIDDGDLSFTCPPRKKIYIGCFPGLSIVAASQFGIDYPSKLPQKFLDYGQNQTIYLHAMHSVVDWFAYAIWDKGKLIRSLSLSPDSGIMEDIGSRMPFEEPFWAGAHPVFDQEEDSFDYPFCFHPLELGEAALLTLFGYELEGLVDSSPVIEPEDIPLAGYKRIRSWWKLW